MTSLRPSRPSVQKMSWLAFLFGCVVGHAQQPLVRTHLESDGKIWTGQRVTLAAELLVPGFFTSAATVDLPETPGVIVMLPNSHPVVGSETIDGTSYTIQRHELSVFAATPGEHVIPPIHARFSYKQGYLDREDIAGTVTTQPIRFTVTPPPGTENLGVVISARHLQAVETWEPEPGKAAAKPGDAFTRTITFTAPDMPGMVFPPFPTTPIEGLRQYPKAPALLDHSEGGEFSGGRRDRVVYVCEHPGTVSIPAVRLTWWDLDAKALRTVDFPARTITIEAGPAQEPAAVATTTAAPWKSLRWPAIAALAAIALLAAIFVLSVSVRRAFARLFSPLHSIPLQPLNPEQWKRESAD